MPYLPIRLSILLSQVARIVAGAILSPTVGHTPLEALEATCVRYEAAVVAAAPSRLSGEWAQGSPRVSSSSSLSDFQAGSDDQQWPGRVAGRGVAGEEVTARAAYIIPRAVHMKLAPNAAAGSAAAAAAVPVATRQQAGYRGSPLKGPGRSAFKG